MCPQLTKLLCRFSTALILLVSSSVFATTTTITFSRADLARISGLWIVESSTLSDLANAQYPSFAGSTWNFGFPHSGTASDGDLHIDLAVSSSGTGQFATCCNGGDSPITAEITNASSADQTHVSGLKTIMTHWLGVFRIRTEHTCPAACEPGERKFEIHPITKLFRLSSGSYVLDTDYTSYVDDVSDGRTHAASTLRSALQDIFTATAQNANPQMINVAIPSPAVNYVEYIGTITQSPWCDGVSNLFLFHPTKAVTSSGSSNITVSAIPKVRLVPGTNAAATAATLGPNSVCTVNALTRVDVQGMLPAINALVAGQSVTQTLPIDLIALSIKNPTVQPPAMHAGQDDTFTSGNIQPPGSASGWSAFGFNTPGFASPDYDAANTAFRAFVQTDPSRFRVTGWVANKTDWLPYAFIGSENYCRVKYYIYATGQANPSALNTIPNLRVRASSRFAVNSMLEVLHHSNGDPANDSLANELRPSSNAAQPSIYRVDFDPVDVPFLTTGTVGEGVQRVFEAYALDPQENGYLGMAESVIGTYPSGAIPNSVAAQKIYQTSASDAGDLAIVSSASDLTLFNLIPGTAAGDFGTIDTSGAPKPTYVQGSAGVTLDTTAVGTDRIGIATREFFPGSDLTTRVRVEENKLYKVRFHATSTQQSNLNAQVRLRVRTGKFSWGQKYEIGGAWTTNGTPNFTTAQQALPGIGCQNPDRISSENGGWYTVLVNSPLSVDIRPDVAGPLTSRMPVFTAEPGPGVNSASRRDLRVAADLIDTISGGINAPLEKGNVTIDRIEIRTYPQIAD